MKEYWAYDFQLVASLPELSNYLEDLSHWKWQHRESSWYGEYLNSRPIQGVRIRIHRYPYESEYGSFVGLKASGYSSLLQIEVGCDLKKEDVDEEFLILLKKLKATEIEEIEPYD